MYTHGAPTCVLAHLYEGLLLGLQLPRLPFQLALRGRRSADGHGRAPAVRGQATGGSSGFWNTASGERGQVAWLRRRGDDSAQWSPPPSLILGGAFQMAVEQPALVLRS